MKKGSALILLILVFVSMFFFNGVYAQENVDGGEQVFESVEQESQDASAERGEFEDDVELDRGAGITPDSALYLVESGILERFRDESSNREKKVAEIKEMISQGKIPDAKVALERYKKHAEELEREVSPNQREEAKRSASAIYNALKEIESEIPEEERSEFFDGIVERERKILTASEISFKIKELCEALSGLDPVEYSRVCMSDENSPSWQRRLDKDLTDQQREEAKKFGKIMQQCFETAGQQCACEEIPFADFSKVCSIAAPLATACEIEGNEEACMQMDELEMPELPPHLQDVMDELENDVSGSRIDLHMPPECREAGATNPNECRKIMIETNAPEECRAALLDANVKNEREAREICEKIMFEQNAPLECVEAGLRDHKECGLFMFKETAPQECLDAGLTGERQSDHKKCREIMDSIGGDRSGPNRGPGQGFGTNCRAIQNSEERLACYDGALQGASDQKSNFDERRGEDQEAMRMCANKCLSAGAAWDFSNGNCECRSSERFDDREFREEFRNPSDSGSFEGEEFRQPPEGEFLPQPEGEFQQPLEGTEGATTESSSGSGSEGTTDSGATTESSSSDGTTGNVISPSWELNDFRR